MLLLAPSHGSRLAISLKAGLNAHGLPFCSTGIQFSDSHLQCELRSLDIEA